MSDDKKPDIRFKDYSDDWEQRKMGDTSEKVCVGFVGTCEKYYTDETGIPMYRTGNLNGLSLNKDDMKYVTRDFHQQNKKSQLKFGDILIARHGDSGKAVNYESSEEANCLNIVIIRPDFKKCNYRFLTDCINSPRCQKHIKSLSAGSTQAVINTSEIEKLEVLLPESIDEQEKIAAYFENLDHLITLHQRKYDKLQNLKKAMLEKMFPKNGCNVPEIRFKGFTDAWEQRKTIDIADYSKGNGYSKGDLTDAGTPIILYGRLYTKYQFAISEVDTFAVPRNGAVYSQGNEVIVPASGETAEDIARASAVEKSGVLLGGDLNILRPFDFMNPLFLALAISNGEPQQELAKKAQGKSVVHIHNSDIQEVTIAYPSRTEQDRIVSVFCQLDNLITLHQRELEKLKNIKKAMLEKMFV